MDAPTLTRRTIPGLHGFSGSQHRLLDAEEEVALGREVVAGLAQLEGPRSQWSFQDLPPGSPARQAADELVNTNIRLVLSLAQQHQTGDGRAFDDAVQDGLIGLMRAVLGFDPEAGTRLATYANFFIRRAMNRGRQFDGSLVRLPVHVHDKILALKRHAEHTDVDLGHLVATCPPPAPPSPWCPPTTATTTPWCSP